MGGFCRLRDRDWRRSLRTLAGTEVDSGSRKALLDPRTTADRANELAALLLTAVVIGRSKPSLEEVPLITPKIKNPHGTTNTSL
jgi:hypothetical protein